MPLSPCLSESVAASQPLRCRQSIQPFLVTAEQMQQIEQRLFAAGMPVAALMEKVSGRLVQWFLAHSFLAHSFFWRIVFGHIVLRA